MLLSEESGSPPIDRRSIGALYATMVFSSAGNTMLTLVLGLHVYQITHRELDLGLLGLMAWTPIFVLVLAAGSVADRFDRRLVIAVALGAESVICLGMSWFASTAPTGVVEIFGLVILYGSARAFIQPAMYSIPVDLVPESTLPKVIARGEFFSQTSFIVAPIAGAALFVYDTSLTYAVIAALLATAGVIALGVTAPRSSHPRRSPEESPSVAERFSDAIEGIRFIRSQPVVLGAVMLDLVAVLMGGAIVLLPAIAEERLGVGPEGVGWLRAAAGFGAVSAFVLLSTRPLQRHIGRHLISTVGLFGVMTILLGLTRSFAVAMIAIVILSAADAISVWVRKTLVPLLTPREKRGRVIAFEQLAVSASNELGAFKTGVLGQMVGPGGAIVVGGVLTVGVVAAWPWLFPPLRKIDRFTDGLPETDLPREVVT